MKRIPVAEPTFDGNERATVLECIELNMDFVGGKIYWAV